MAEGTGSVDSSLGLDLTSRFRIIQPSRYRELGIDPDGILVGTIAAENHPGYLLSRLGGNAFGLGLVEMLDQLQPEEAGLLEGLDLSDPDAAAERHEEVNAIYERFGLLIRYSSLGRPYYLIPVAWLAQSTAEVQDRAEMLAAEIRAVQTHRRREQLNIIIISPGDDLLTAEMMRRTAGHRVVVASGPDEVARASGPFDIALILQDMATLLLRDPPVDLGGNRPRKRSVFALGQYLMAKLYDRLDTEGRLVMIAPRQSLPAGEPVEVRFPNEDEQRNFLLFSHACKTRQRYRWPGPALAMDIWPGDLYDYLTRDILDARILSRLTGGRPPGEMTAREVDGLAWLDSRPPRGSLFPDQKLFWERLTGPFFSPRNLVHRSLKRTQLLWTARLGLSEAFPPTDLLFVGDRNRPPVNLERIEDANTGTGLPGCPLHLVAGYKDSFAYLLKVIGVLEEIRQLRFADLAPLERARLSTPFQFKGPYAGFFRNIIRLTRLAPRLRRLQSILNPFDLEGERTPVLSNLEKLSLMGLETELLNEIYLIVVGHSAIGRVTLGKVPERALVDLSRQMGRMEREEAVNTVRAVRLLTVAEMAALVDKSLPDAQAAEAFSLAEKVIRVSADPDLDWERLQENQIAGAGGATNWSVRRLLKLVGLFEFMDHWQELLSLGPRQKEVRAGLDPERVGRIESVIELVNTVREFKDRFGATYSFERPYFFRRLLEFEFHGTARLLPALGPRQAFKLIWLVVNLSPLTRVNFNRLLAGPPEQTLAQRVETIRQVLARLSIEDLSPEHLTEIRGRLKPGRPGFVRQAGLALTVNRDLGAMEVALFQIEQHITRLEELTGAAEGKPISTLDHDELKEMDLLYGRLADYTAFQSRQPITDIVPDVERQELIGRRLRMSAQAGDKLRKALSGRLFKPEFIHDHLFRLRRAAPRLLDLLIPEMAEMDRLPPAHPNYPGRTMLHYFMRSTRKYQALVIGDAGGFQNRDVQLTAALEEFGAEAGSGVGLTSDQMTLLRELIGRLGEKRHLLRAVGLALIFQDIGRLPSRRRKFEEMVDFGDHGLAGGIILVQDAVLSRYPMSPKAREATVFLVRHHGLLGRVVRGEAPLVELDRVTSPGDEDLLTAAFIHNVVGLAAVHELAMTGDLFDALNWLRTEGLSVIRGTKTWRNVVGGIRRNQGCLPAALDEAMKEDSPPSPSSFGRICRRLTGEMPPEQLKAGQRTVAGATRLFRMRGLWHLTYEAVSLFRLNIRGRHIYRMLGVTSLGQASVERDLYEAVRLQTEGLDQVEPRVRDYLIDRLADIDRPVVLFGFPFFSRWVSQINRITAAVLGLKAAERLAGEVGETVTVSYQQLEELVGTRYEFINQALADLPLDRLLDEEDYADQLAEAEQGFRLVFNPDLKLVTILFIDPLRPDEFAARLDRMDDPEELESAYLNRMEMLHNRTENTRPHRRQTTEIFQQRLDRVIDARTDWAIDLLLGADNLSHLFAQHEEITDGVDARWFDDIQLGRINNAFEVRKEQLHQRLEEEILVRLETASSRDEIDQMWEALREEIRTNRQQLGRALEDRLARMFDLHAARLRQSRLW